MAMKIELGAGVWNVQEIEQGGLLDFVVRVKVGLQAWKDFLPHCAEKLCIIHRGIEDFT